MASRRLFDGASNELGLLPMEAPVFTGSLSVTVGAATFSGSAGFSTYRTVGRYTQNRWGTPGQLYGSFERGGADTFTATANWSTGAATFSGAGEFDQPVYTGSLTATVGAATFSGAAEFDQPVYTGTLAATVGAATFAGAGEFDQPVYTGTLTATVGAATFSGAAEFDQPVYTGALAVTAGAATFAGTGIFAAQVFSATGAWTTGAATFAGSAEFDQPVYTGSLVATTGAAIFAGAGEFDQPVYTGTLTATVGAATFAGAGEFDQPVYTGALTATVGAATFTGAGEFDQPVYTGTLTATVGAATFAGAGEFDQPAYTGTLTATVGAATFSGTAEFDQPVYTGTLSATVGAAAFAGAGEFDQPVYTGALAATTGAATFVGSGIFAAQVFSGAGTWTTGAATFAGSGEFDAPVYTGSLAVTTGGASFAGTGEFDSPVYTGTLAVTTGPAAFSGSGEFDVPVFTGTLTAVTGGATFSGSGEFDEPVYTGTLSATVGAASFAGVGEFDSPVYTGTLAVTTGPVSFVGAGEATGPSFTATLAVTTGAATFAGAGEFDQPVYTATGSFIVGAAVLSGAGTFDAPVFSAAAALTTGAALFSGSALFAPSWSEGVGLWGTGAATFEAVADYSPPGADADLICESGPRTAVNQPPSGGSNYPFTGQASGLQCLIQDLHLDWRDTLCGTPPGVPVTGQPATPAVPGRKAPFYLAFLSGFDTVMATWATISGDWDDFREAWGTGELFDFDNARMVFEDAEGETVFDTQGITPVVGVLSMTRAEVLWSDEEQGTLRVVFNMDVITPSVMAPDDAEIDPRTYNRTPLRVRTLNVNTAEMNGHIDIVCGYNTNVTIESVTAVDGARRRTRLIFSARPGEGLGKYSDCSEVVPVLRAVNGAVADAAGNLSLDGDGCFRLQKAVTLDGSPTLALFSYAGLTATEARSAIVLNQDCGPRCPDLYFLNVYRGIYRMWNLWQGIATDAEEVRNVLRELKERWDSQRECRLNSPGKLFLAPENGCKVSIGGVFCNMTGVCLPDLEIRFRLTVFDRTIPDDTEGSPCAQAVIQGSDTQGQENTTMTGVWPQYTMPFLYANPQDSSMVRFRVCIPGCTGTQSLRVTMTVHGPDVSGASNYPNLGDGSFYGSVHPIRFITEKTVPFDTQPPSFGCEC